jgi:hypothetical protein
MNTSFAGNQVGSIVSLDVAGSYPLGILSQLGPYYNYSQEQVNAQVVYTANQAEITSQKAAEYALQNLEIKKIGGSLPNSDEAVSVASVYINGAKSVNYRNENLVTLANTDYVNASAIEKLASDASYSAFLTLEASNIRIDRINSLEKVVQLGNTPITINPLNLIFPSTISTMIATTRQTSDDALDYATQNLQGYIINTQTLLSNTITESTSVTANKTLVASFNTLVRTIAEAVSFPLLEIAGKETLVTQNVPSIILTVAIRLVNKTQDFINALITNTITTEITSMESYANILDSIARSNNLIMYKQNKIKNILKDNDIQNKTQYTYTSVAQHVTASAANAEAIERLRVAELTDASGYNVAVESAIVGIAAVAAAISPEAAMALALNAGVSASNARAVSNAIINLNIAYTNAITKQPIILTTASESLATISSLLSVIITVMSNSSAHSAVAITRRASNTIQGILKKIRETERVSLESAANAKSVLTLLNLAYSIVPTYTDTIKIREKLWAINAASAKAKEVADKLKDKVILLNRTVNNPVTFQKLADQTASANTAGILSAHQTFRINNNSRNTNKKPPPVYNKFKADIRAKTITPIRPTLDELVYRNRIQPLRLDSLRTVCAVNIKVAQNVQQISDKSEFSYTQQ